MLEVTEKSGAITFRVRVQPRASRTELAGEYAGAVKIRICAPPIEGRANEECARFLADLLEISRRDVEIVAGASSRDKIIRVHGASIERIRRMLSS
jgi:uncharacterized protein